MNVFILPFTKDCTKPHDVLEIYFTLDGVLGLLTLAKDTDVLVRDHKRCSSILRSIIKDITRCPKNSRIHLINLKQLLIP